MISCIPRLGNSISNQPKIEFVTHHLRFSWNFYQWVDKIQICSWIQLALLDLWTIKHGSCQPIPIGEKLPVWLALFHINCNISRMLHQNKLKFCILPNVRALNLILMVEKGEYESKSCYFGISVRLTNSRNRYSTVFFHWTAHLQTVC